jgi:hypothetical protein
MASFEDILNQAVDDIEKPKPRPTGHYLGVVAGLPQQVVQGTKDGDRSILRFMIKPIAAQEDVDQDNLAEHGELATWPPFRRDYWIDTPEGLYNAKLFLTEVLGIEAGKGATFSQIASESPGKQVVFELGHRPFVRDGQPEIATEIKSVAKA